jgi:ion channel-forming bestrophin family protein
MKLKKFSWFKIAFQLQGSVVPSVLNRVIFSGVFALIISVLYQLKIIEISDNWTKTLSTIVPSITLVLGLLLVFRTNTAYDRFWEGRKLWGNLANTARNLARHIWVNVDENNPEVKEKKIEILRLIVAFLLATKLHLRDQKNPHELERCIQEKKLNTLTNINHIPLEITFWIEDELQHLYKQNCINVHQLNFIQQLINLLVDSLGGCERILRTPIPFAYAIHLKQLLLLYCVLLSFLLANSLQLATAPVVALISFTLFGIEEIGIEIENPFGHDPNDLPLDTICQNISNNVEELISQTPSSIY